MRLPSDATLIVIDPDSPQEAGDARTAIGHLVDVWHGMKLPIVLVSHEADRQDAGEQPAPPLEPRDGATMVQRIGASAFMGTALESDLTARGCTTLVVCGIGTEHAVEATVRQAADLGFRLFVVADACAATGPREAFGQMSTAEQAQAMSLANMATAGAKIVDIRTAWIAAKGAGWGRR